ncbi:MAG TPA: hypothetical protein VFU50_16555 [Terriglobales bacterium]|nr:hypothetical protein [Terriglobales bacterium]
MRVQQRGYHTGRKQNGGGSSWDPFQSRAISLQNSFNFIELALTECSLKDMLHARQSSLGKTRSDP